MADEKGTAPKSDAKDEIPEEKLDEVSGGGVTAAMAARRVVMEEPMLAMPVLKAPVPR